MAPLSYAPPPDVDVAPDTVRHLAGKEEVDELDFLLDELRIVDEPTSKSRVVQPHIEQHGIPPSTIGGGKQDRNDDLDLEEW
eukprot:tig00000383_g24659.t1